MTCSLQAARDALEKMGNKKFYEQLLQDIMQQEHSKITHESDVITLKDYMQVLHVISLSSDNGWRARLLNGADNYNVTTFMFIAVFKPFGRDASLHGRQRQRMEETHTRG